MKSRLIILGGFLGAGKTTLLTAAATILQKQHKKVGIITNDQAKGLVDTLVLSNSATNVKEIAGSCFCCDFDGLMDAALYLKDTIGCEIILCEPVGSCTDLSSTLFQPIKSYYQQHFQLSPLSVLVDPHRAEQMLDSGQQNGSGYIYLKQLEEADCLVINKVDKISKQRLASLRKKLKEVVGQEEITGISALDGTGVTDWLELLETSSDVGTRIADIDYDIYAEGEAEMGWYNADFMISHAKDGLVRWGDFTLDLLQIFQKLFLAEGIVLGHLKVFLKGGPSHLSANLTDSKGTVELQGVPFSDHAVRMIINIRAETSPQLLKQFMEDIISVYSEQDIAFRQYEINALTPGRPKPSHRFTDVVTS